MEVSAAVGLVSGLIAIFSFLTGVSSIRGLRRPAGSGSSPAAERHRTRQWVVLGLSAPVFLVSMAVTLGRGLMSGDDTGGTRFLLLLLGAVFLWRYAVRWHASVPWPAFLLGGAVVLGALGWLFGTISAGSSMRVLVMPTPSIDP